MKYPQKQDLAIKAIVLIIDSYAEACKLHPSWEGYDVVHCVSKMVEEAGESLKIANDIHEKGEFTKDQRDALITEVAQTGAMALRNLVHLLDQTAYIEEEK